MASNIYSPSPPKQPPSAQSSSRRSSYRRNGNSSDTDYHHGMSTPTSRPSSSLTKYRTLPPIGRPQQSNQSEAVLQPAINKLPIGDNNEKRKTLVNSGRERKAPEHGVMRTVSHQNRPTQYRGIGTGLTNNRGDAIHKHHGSSEFNQSVATSKNKTDFDFKRREPYIESNAIHNKQSSVKSTNVHREVGVKTHSNPSNDSRSVDRNSNIDTEIVLALRFPDSTRLEHTFSANDTLGSVLRYAEVASGQNFSGYCLVSSAPRNVYSRLNWTLSKCGITSRMVLHVEDEEGLT